MSKFKPGDRVVVLIHKTAKHKQNPGPFLVDRFSVYSTEAEPKYVLNKTPYYYEEYELEFENIYNSPLYNALK